MLLSIDVAIKNLAFCLFEIKDAAIKKWELIDLIHEDSMNDECSGLTTKKIKCNKTATFVTNDNKKLCKVHSKKIDKDNISELKSNYKCNMNGCINDIYVRIPEDNIGLCLKHKKIFKEKDDKKVRYYTVKNISDNELRVLLFKKLDSYNFELYDIKKVIIEKQPKHATEQMRSVAYALYDYFLIKLLYKCKIKWIDPKNKLTVYNGPVIQCDLKDPYKRNKWYACKYCEWYLTTRNDTNLDFFNLNKKKDDLADCYLQGIYYIENKGRPKKLTQQQQNVYKEQNIIKYNKIKARKPKVNKLKYTLSEVKYCIMKGQINSNVFKTSMIFFFGDNFDIKTLTKGAK